jgi:hypothetical protein
MRYFLTYSIIGFMSFLSQCTSSYDHDFVGQDSVLVRVNNQSGYHIKKIILIHEKGKIQMENIPDEKSTKIIFKSAGENSYKIFAVFDNDSTLTSQEMYTEGGYRILETVYTNQIKSEYQSSY